MGPRVYMRIWCANWCVVVLDWYMYRVLVSDQNPGEPNPLLQMAFNTSHPPT